MASYYQLETGYVLALDANTPFPPLDHALTEPNGLLAIGDQLRPTRILDAYRRGIFPWFSEGEPVLWWSPNPRMVLFPHELVISHSLKKRLKKTDYEVRYNSAFRQVIQACASTSRPTQHGTWITDSIMDAYCELHEMGIAHSAETWINGELVGGLYGLAIGKMFYGESMFHHVTDGSKIAFVHMVQRLSALGVGMIDCQMKTSHLASLGAREIPRHAFARILETLIDQPLDTNTQLRIQP